MSEYITYAKPPTVCRVQSCYCDAYITIMTDNGEEIPICPACIEELHTLQAGVTLPEQRARVIDFHIPPNTSREIVMDVTRMGRAEPPPIDDNEEQ